MSMNNHFMFDSDDFKPTPGELDETHDDYINPGIFALNLADFLVEGLKTEGVAVKFRCQEDWGHWMEVDHDGKFRLAIGCANLDDGTHRFIVEARKPFFRGLLSKIEVEPHVENLIAAIIRVLERSGKARNIRAFE